MMTRSRPSFLCALRTTVGWHGLHLLPLLAFLMTPAALYAHASVPTAALAFDAGEGAIASGRGNTAILHSGANWTISIIGAHTVSLPGTRSSDAETPWSVLGISSTAPLQVSDVIRATQSGPGPVPVGAPGKGRYLPPLPANPNLPTLWLIGDSTVRNGTAGDNGPTGQWGWGAPLPAFFDLEKINVVNRAFGGTSSRTFYSGFFWKNLQPQIKKGDFVIMQFGANDNGGAKGKGGLSGIGDETEMNNDEIVHTFGWYLKQFVTETRTQGATPIICSLTPRKHWSADGTHFQRDNGTHAAWAEQVAKETNTPFIPLYDIIAAKYEKLGMGKVDTLYVPSPTEKLHTGWEGAVINAECVISGLKALPDDLLAKYLAPRASTIAPASGITEAGK